MTEISDLTGIEPRFASLSAGRLLTELSIKK